MESDTLEISGAPVENELIEGLLELRATTLNSDLGADALIPFQDGRTKLVFDLWNQWEPGQIERGL